MTTNKMTKNEFNRIENAYLEHERFHSVAELAAILPGFSGFHAWQPENTVFDDTEYETEYDELYADHFGVTIYSNSESYKFMVDNDEIEIVVTGTNSAKTVNGIAIETTSIADDIATTEWKITDIY